MKSYRVGGDEFIVITYTKGRGIIEEVAKRIIEGAKVPVKIKDKEVYFTMSLGVVKSHNNIKDEENLVKEAKRLPCLLKERGVIVIS